MRRGRVKEGRLNAVNPTKQSHIDRDLMDRPPRRHIGVAKGGSHAAWSEVADDDAAAKRGQSGFRKRGKLQEAVVAQEEKTNRSSRFT